MLLSRYRLLSSTKTGYTHTHTRATALSEMKPAAMLPAKPPTSRALMYELPTKKKQGRDYISDYS